MTNLTCSNLYMIRHRSNKFLTHIYFIIMKPHCSLMPHYIVPSLHFAIPPKFTMEFKSVYFPGPEAHLFSVLPSLSSFYLKYDKEHCHAGKFHHH